MSASVVDIRRYLPAGALPAPVCALVVGDLGGSIDTALRASSIAVQAVEGGPAAFAFIATQLPTDVVVIDAARPDEHVIALIAALRRHRYWRCVPILLLESACGTANLGRAFEAGADECLPRTDHATLTARVLEFAGAA